MKTKEFTEISIWPYESHRLPIHVSPRDWSSKQNCGKSWFHIGKINHVYGFLVNNPFKKTFQKPSRTYPKLPQITLFNQKTLTHKRSNHTLLQSTDWHFCGSVLYRNQLNKPAFPTLFVKKIHTEKFPRMPAAS